VSDMDEARADRLHGCPRRGGSSHPPAASLLRKSLAEREDASHLAGGCTA